MSSKRFSRLRKQCLLAIQNAQGFLLMNWMLQCRAERHIGFSVQGRDAISGHAAGLCSFPCGIRCGLIHSGAGLNAVAVQFMDRHPAGAEYSHLNHEQCHERPADTFGTLQGVENVVHNLTSAIDPALKADPCECT